MKATQLSKARPTMVAFPQVNNMPRYKKVLFLPDLKSEETEPFCCVVDLRQTFSGWALFGEGEFPSV